MSSENLRLSLGTCTDGSKGTSAVFGFATGAFFRGGVDMEAATGNIGAFLAGGENRLLFSAGRGGGREGGDAKELFKKGLLMVSCRRVRFWFNAQRAKTSVREIKPPHNARCDHVCTLPSFLPSSVFNSTVGGTARRHFTPPRARRWLKDIVGHGHYSHDSCSITWASQRYIVLQYK